MIFGYTITRTLDGSLIPGDSIGEVFSDDIAIFKHEGFSVVNAAGEQTLNLVGCTADKIKMIIIESSEYDSSVAGNELIMKFHLTGETPQAIRGPVSFERSTFVYVGVVPDALLITNTLASAADVTVDVWIAYDPT